LQGESNGEPRVVAISIYSDHADQEKQTGLAMIGALIKQLVWWSRSIPATVRDLFRQRSQEKRSLDEIDAKEIFGLVLDQYDTVYICIDAMDECAPESRAQLLRFLKAMDSPSIRLFMTGRHSVEAEIASTLSSLSPKTISITAAEEDIRIYLSQKLESDQRRGAMTEDLKDEIVKKLVGVSQGL
jgi:hypothetical protein